MTGMHSGTEQTGTNVPEASLELPGVFKEHGKRITVSTHVRTEISLLVTGYLFRWCSAQCFGIRDSDVRRTGPSHQFIFSTESYPEMLDLLRAERMICLGFRLLLS